MSLPSYPRRVPLAAPYWNSATFWAIRRSLFSGGLVDGPDLPNLRSLVIRNLGVEEALLCGSGSFAIEIALRACGVGQGDEVVIPTFCCTAVVPPILAAGALPVLADVGSELNLTAATVEPLLTKRTRAIIVPHLFGNPAEIHAIAGLAAGKHIRIIDDAAQALGGAIDGSPLGTFGDAGILSFGREKICSGLGGGVAVSRHKGLLDKLGGELPSPRASTALWTLFSTLVRSRWRRWTFPLEGLSTRANSSPDSPPDPYRKEAMANLSAAVASSLLQTLRENIAARRARVEAYRELLGKEEGLELIPHRPGSACLAQVVRLLPRDHPNDLSVDVIHTLGRAGYEVQGSYVPIHMLPAYHHWVRRRLFPYAERVWADLIELPCEPDVSLDNVERITGIIGNILNA